MEKQIKLSSLQEVQDFVSVAEKCDFDIDIFYNSYVIDAKSILGVLKMDLTRNLTVRYDGENGEFEGILDKFAVK